MSLHYDIWKKYNFILINEYIYIPNYLYNYFYELFYVHIYNKNTGWEIAARIIWNIHIYNFW